MPRSAYSSAARKTQGAFQKTYGAKWKSVYYALANKRTGGFKGKNHGAKAANLAYAKGKRFGKRGGGSRRKK